MSLALIHTPLLILEMKGKEGGLRYVMRIKCPPKPEKKLTLNSMPQAFALSCFFLFSYG